MVCDNACCLCLSDVLIRLNTCVFFVLFFFCDFVFLPGSPEAHQCTPHARGFHKLQVFESIPTNVCSGKMIFLDTDMLVLNNPDVLFERPHLSASIGWSRNKKNKTKQEHKIRQCKQDKTKHNKLPKKC